MARVLAISSQVVRGHVGLSAIVPALQRLGHEAWPVPTVLLSNHPGHTRSAACRIAADDVARMIEALALNGWLDDVDAVITGYLPSQDHVRVACDTVRRIKAVRAVPYLCDPVLGDEPKGVYIDTAAARAIRDTLIPLADIATPNRFELGWLTDRCVATLGEVANAARALGPATVIATSAEISATHIANLMVTSAATLTCSTERIDDPPHGTGDLLAGLYFGMLLAAEPSDSALGRAVAGVEAVLRASRGSDELVLGRAAADWSRAEPKAVMIPAGGLGKQASSG